MNERLSVGEINRIWLSLKPQVRELIYLLVEELLEEHCMREHEGLKIHKRNVDGSASDTPAWKA